MKVAFHTLGCKVNQNDTQSLSELFLQKGYEIVPFEVGADIYVVNTCAVTQVSEQKSRQTIRKAISKNPEAIVVVTGCYAQTSPREIAGIPGVSLVVGMSERLQLVDIVEEFRQNRHIRTMVKDISSAEDWLDLPEGNFEGRTRANLKIEEGCEQFCSYCIVPYARGKVRSMPMELVVERLTGLVDKGYREIVLSGIHLGCYGKDLGTDLTKLLERLISVKGDYRIRLGSIEPLDLKPELLETVVNNPKVCQYLHIPLQSGCDRILQRMNRGYQRSYYEELLDQIRAGNPFMGIGTDLIVGFPGETEADFLETEAFVERMGFSRMHIFRYSPRKGTPAADFPGRISKQLQEIRAKRIHQIATKNSLQFAQHFVNNKVEVLFEELTSEGWVGLSGEYLHVCCKTDFDLRNLIETVDIIAIEKEQLLGTISATTNHR